ncbi:MAG: hypothetical protein C0446_08455 [Chitinophaga sp.]|nr:hypothetical protein [Chitinophaga sp.]
MKFEQLFISGSIELSGDFNIAAHISDVAGIISGVPRADALIININSNGGDLIYGLEVCNAIRSSPIPVVAIISPAAESAAALIAASCDKSLIIENGWIMIHSFSSSLEGTYYDQKAIQKHNNILHQAMINILKDRTGLKPTEIEAQLLNNTDTWLSAQEAYEIGLVDGVIQLGTDIREVVCHVLKE